jgi:hypothetical protein
MDQRRGDILAHRESKLQIQISQIFNLQRYKHMPSWELLEVQWDLLQAAALCSAADVMDEYYGFKDPGKRG